MNAATVKKFQELLAARLRELGIETNYAEGGDSPQTGDTLRALLPVTDAGNVTLLELMVVSLGDELDLLSFNTTVLLHLGPGAGAVERAVPGWNLMCPIGAFGVFEGDQLYHKYTYPFRADTKPEALAEDAMLLVELIFKVLAGSYGEAAALSAKTT